jgi:hypothetical protein
VDARILDDGDPLRAPVPRRDGTRIRWEGPPGPRPPVARVLTVSYACVGALVAVAGILHGVDSLWAVAFFVGFTAYCGSLAWGASRLRLRSVRSRGSVWICLPLLAHAAAGAAGAVALIGGGFEMRTAIGDYGGAAAMYAVLLGWVPALVPAAGTLFLFLLVAFDQAAAGLSPHRANARVAPCVQ